MAEASVIIIGEEYCREEERELTVRKTSLFYPGDGYAAYDHVTGELVFRVDSYGRGTSVSDHLVLMDPTGAPILTVRRKRPSLHQRWEGFLGEREEGQKPLFSVKRSSIFGKDRSIDVELHETDNKSSSNTGSRQYRIVGCFAQRTCKVLMARCSDLEDEHEEMVAEIKRKVDAFSHVVLAKDVFCLCIKPGFDAAFAMGLVLVLDQISGDEDNDNDDHSIFRSVNAYRVAPANDDDDTSITVE